MNEVCLLSLFGIQVNYSPSWRVIPDQSYSLNYDSGMIRFEENVAEKRSRVSMGLRWECSLTDNTSFLNEFDENIHKEYQKALKRKSQEFEMIRDEIVQNAHGVNMLLIETRYKATQSLVNNPKKMQRLCVNNCAYYCEDTHRIVICSIVTTPQYMEENRFYLEGLLTSLDSSPVYSEKFEQQRMKIRAEKREAASRRSVFGLNNLKGIVRRGEKK